MNQFSDVKSIYLVAMTTYVAILVKLELIIRNEDWISPQISGGTPWNGFIMNSDCRQTKRSIMMKNLSRLLLPS